ncbi:MAG: hydroxyisourate hydrolase [Gemmatimonadales bacterium]
MSVTTHVLDTASGLPASGIKVSLETLAPGDKWTPVAWATTDDDGRVKELLPPDFQIETRRYRLVFDTATYFQAKGVDSFYPVVIVVFEVLDPHDHYHVPLLLSPYGYSTYRGS